METPFSHCKLWENFLKRSRAANLVVSGPIWLKFKLVRDFTHVLITWKYKKDWLKSNREKVETSSPLLVSGSFLLPWKPEFWSNLPPNLMQPFPNPSDAIHNLIKIGQLASEIFKFESVDNDDGPLVNYKLTLWALSSQELKSGHRNILYSACAVIPSCGNFQWNNKKLAHIMFIGKT